MTKVLGVLGLVFSLIGVGISTGAFFLYRSTQSFIDSALVAQGTVVENVRRTSQSKNSSSPDITWAPRVQFETRAGQRIDFTSSSSSRPAEYDVGDHVEVLYAPTDPSDARLQGTLSVWGGTFILGLLGALFTAVGFGMGIAVLIKLRRRAALLAAGVTVQATYMSVERNQNVSSDGVSPWRVLCQWQDPATARIHVFKSDDVWFDPTEYVRSKRLTVFVNPNNLRHHAVDLSFLPELAE